MVNVGDKVRIVDNTHDGSFKIGEDVFVTNVLSTTIEVRRIKEDRPGYQGLTQEYDPSDLVLVEAAKPEASALPNMTLPTDSAARKNYPLLRGCVNYFPAALAGVSLISKLGNDKHNPGQELHHARGKSTDHADCVVRHLIDVQDLLAALQRQDKDVTPEQVLTEVSQLAWRALAYSQELHEKFGAPLAPGAKNV